MSAIAPSRAAVPEQPGYLTNVWDVFVAFLLAGIGVGAVVVAARIVGVLGFSSMSAGRPDPIDWPFPHAGAWSIAANVVATAAVLLLCAVAISKRLARRADAPVSWLRVFAIVAFTGYAPFAAYHGLVPLHFFFGLLATALLARWLAIGVEPPRLSRRTRTLLVVGGAALLCIPAAYGSTHPLWYGSFVGIDSAQTEWPTHRVVFSPPSARTFAYGFFLQNASRAHVKLLGISGTGTASFLRVVRAEPGITFPGRSARPFRDVAIGAEQDQALTLYIRTRGCRFASGTFSLDRVYVRYQIAGLTLSQPVTLAIRPTVVCH